MTEKNKKPTKKKLDDAAEKGQVPHSPALVRFVSSVALLELILDTRATWLPLLQNVLGQTLERLESSSFHDDIPVESIAIPTLAVAGLLGAIATGFSAALGVVANILQTGFIIAPKAMPHWESFDVMANITQMFSAERLSELGLSITKVVCISVMGYLSIYSCLDTILHLGDQSLEKGMDLILDLVAFVERRAMAAILPLVLLDWAVKRYMFMKQMYMSEEEVKQERKDSDGSPETKNQRKKISREIILNEAMQRIKKADVLVTNPTHFAVALLFRMDVTPLPIVLARGHDDMARKMIEVARKEGVPIVRFVWLARTLFSVGREDQPIPRLTLRAVAAVYVALHKLTTTGGSASEPIELGTDPDDPIAKPMPRTTS